MNIAMELLRSKAQQLYDSIAGESNIELQIDPVEEPIALCVQQTTKKPRLEVNTFIKKRDEKTQSLDNGLMEGNNLHANWCVQQLNLIEAQSKVKVWIYNVSHSAYTLGNGLVKELAVPECPEDAEYAVVTSLPAVVIQPKPNFDTGDMDYTLFDGRRVAMDLINPSNLGTDQDFDADRLRSFAVGTNYNLRGVFFSTHNPPLKKELKAAHKRMKAYYTDLMDRANIVRVIAAAPALGVSVAELKAAQEYVEDAVFNR